jgi:hypothetical protein
MIPHNVRLRAILAGYFALFMTASAVKFTASTLVVLTFSGMQISIRRERYYLLLGGRLWQANAHARLMCDVTTPLSWQH